MHTATIAVLLFVLSLCLQSAFPASAQDQVVAQGIAPDLDSAGNGEAAGNDEPALPSPPAEHAAAPAPGGDPSGSSADGPARATPDTTRYVRGAAGSFVVIRGSDTALARYPAGRRFTELCLNAGEQLTVLEARSGKATALAGPGCSRPTPVLNPLRRPTLGRSIFRVQGGSDTALARYPLEMRVATICLHDGEELRVDTGPQSDGLTLHGPGCTRSAQLSERRRARTGATR